jgi:hypothetical protein
MNARIYKDGIDKDRGGDFSDSEFLNLQNLYSQHLI